MELYLHSPYVFMVCCLINHRHCTIYITLNDVMIERMINGNKVKGSSQDLFYGNIPAAAWEK
jgi:hypothetical protein